MVSVSMFDTDKVYFGSMSALEVIIHQLFEICTNERLFSIHMVTIKLSWQVEKIFNLTWLSLCERCYEINSVLSN